MGEHPGAGLFPADGYEFVQGDALQFVAKYGREFDAIHASPPCQAFTSMRRLGNGAGVGAPDLVDPARSAMQATGKPWVIENVPGAPLRNPIIVCGSAFGLAVRRHRLFESNVPLVGTTCKHPKHVKAIGVYGDHPQRAGETARMLSRSDFRQRASSLAEAREAMGIDWMKWRPLTQAIPPVYCEFIGRQLIEHVSR